MKNIFKIISLNLNIAIIAIIGYSPGFLNLRLSDESVFRAGMSIILGLFLLIIGIIANLRFISPKSKRIYISNNAIDITDTVSILETYKQDLYIGNIAKTGLEQINRLNKSVTRTEMEIKRKFGESAISYSKYHSVIDNANKMILENLISLGKRLQLYDANELERLKNYKDDDIPDEIQEKQIGLIKRNYEQASKAIIANENLILSLDTLAMEITELSSCDDDKSHFLEEIEQLTEEVKYYI